MERAAREKAIADFFVGFCLCGLAFYGSAWCFLAITDSFWPEFAWRWAEIEVWKKVLWFTVLPTALFAGIGVLVLRRRRFLGWGILSFLVVELALFLTGMSAAFFL